MYKFHGSKKPKSYIHLLKERKNKGNKKTHTKGQKKNQNNTIASIYGTQVKYLKE